MNVQGTLRPRVLYPWLVLLYVASGYPYGLVNRAAPLLYRSNGVDLSSVTLLTLASLPWVLKFLWAPAVDRLATRKAWIVPSLFAMSLFVVWLSFLPPDALVPGTWVVLLSLAFASATQDAAVDGYAVQAIPAGHLGPANAARVSAYRFAALILAGGGMIAAADWLAWRSVWWACAALLACLGVAAAFAPRQERLLPRGVPATEAFRRLGSRRGFWALAVFVLLFKLGDQAMSPVTKPLLLERGFAKWEIGLWLPPIEVAAMVAGAALGGTLVRVWGIFRSLWVLGLLQAASNLGYAAWADSGKDALVAATAIEQFCGGLGTAPFLALLMVSCEAAHAGTQFALLTGIMAAAGIAAGSASGAMVEWMGYVPWFAVTAALALPAYLFLPSVKRWLDDAQRAAPP